MMLRQTPPLEAAEAFLAATEATSFRAAAKSLALSPSAFSRRIQLLEAFLGVALFDRDLGRAILTPVGRKYQAEIAPAIEAIRRASLNVRAPEQGTVRLATSHSLAGEWLVPRLTRAKAELDLTIELVVTTDKTVLEDGRAEIGIWGGNESDGGETIVTLEAVPLIADSQYRRGKGPRSLDELESYPILDVRHPADGWRRWFSAEGIIASKQPAAVYDTNQLCYEAAASGMGIALGVPLLANRYLRDGRLRACALRSVPTGLAYRLSKAPPRTQSNAAMKRLTSWLRAEAQASKEEFRQLIRPVQVLR